MPAARVGSCAEPRAERRGEPRAGLGSAGVGRGALPRLTAVPQPLAALLRRACLGLGALLLAACASVAPPPDAQRSYGGRFAASVQRGAERESFSGRFLLMVLDGGIRLDLASPLGNTLARIEVGSHGARLTAPQADGALAVFTGSDADALAQTVLGFALPVSGLPDWIAGRAAPDRPARLEPEDGPAQRIAQDGWTIVIDERSADLGTPSRLTLSRDEAGPPPTALRLRLLLDPPLEEAAQR